MEALLGYSTWNNWFIAEGLTTLEWRRPRELLMRFRSVEKSGGGKTLLLATFCLELKQVE